MTSFPRWKQLMFTASLTVLPACGMEAPDAAETPTAPALGQTREALSVGTESSVLSMRGGSGGSPGISACPAGHVAVGIQGLSEAYINSLGLLCRALNVDGTLGAASAGTVVGNGWGSAFTRECPAGMAVVGFPGSSGQVLDGLGLHCAAPNAWMNNSQVQASVAVAGGSSGNAFSDVCGSQQVVTRLNVSAGNNVDSEQGVCTRLVAPYPASCRDIKAANPSAANGSYQLYVGGDAAKPWTAWCHDMAGTPVEFLSLPSTAASANFSQYTAGYNNGGGSNVRTVFTKVRIDPTTLRVSNGNQTFATSSGQLTHGGPVTSMSYAAAMNCDFGNPGLGNVDLRGTPFAVAPNQFAAVGYYASGEATYSANNQVVELWGRGECGWIAVQGADHPMNGRDSLLQLQYVAPTQPRSGSFTFNATNTGNATQNTTSYEVRLAAGETIQFGTCSVTGASGSGDTFLLLFAPNGTEVAQNDDACGGVLSFINHAASQTGTYRIQAGCYSSAACSGTVAFTLQ